MNVALGEQLCYQHKCKYFMTTIAFKELYKLIQRAEFSFFADDLSVDMLY